MRHGFWLLLSAGLAFAPAGSPALAQYPNSKTAPSPPPVHFNDEQKADLKRISIYLATLKSVQGRFLQIGPDGCSDQGTFYLKSPAACASNIRSPIPI